ncbi:MAG: phosphatidylglycerophosphatase A [Gammaproteobacteria bacterium]|nr:MAG: phosphatidylglycerophosphatase A [Gammaproteobacteria bacterium]
MSKNVKIPVSMLRNPAHFLSLGLGSGLSAKAPGTAGTVVAVLLFLPMQRLPAAIYLALLVAAFVLGVWLCGYTTRALGVHDHGGIVWDEFVGYWITMCGVPAGWYWLVLGFVLFRLFDIWKPWPIKWADQKVKGGFGIMLDDVLAGIWAWLCLQAIIWIAGIRIAGSI